MHSMRPALAALLLATPLLLAAGDVGVYDDFGAAGIDAARWRVEGAGFTQPGDGFLHYSHSGPGRARLVSTALFKSGVFTMPFSRYRCDNRAPPAAGLGSVVALGLGLQDLASWVRIERGQIQSDPQHGILGGYIEVNWVTPDDPGRIRVNYVQTDWTAGFLQIRHDGSRATFFYRERESDPWTQMVVTGRGGRPVPGAEPLEVPVRWPAGAPLFVQAFPGGRESDGYALSVAVDRVGAVPFPAN
jgi:hypothetical protein